MKNRLVVFAFLVGFLMTGYASPGNGTFAIGPLKGKPLDYSKRSNWMVFPDKAAAKHKVDVFFLYPTSVSPKCRTLIGEVDADMKHSAMRAYLCDASCFADYANVYVPYHRQVSGVGIMRSKTAEDLEKIWYDSVVRTDVYAALDHFFEKLNDGRPFILAGHSQGSGNLKMVLSEYMRLHPERLKRMIACYAIGYYFPETWFNANPHVGKAQGETDTGVLISWNTEAPGATKVNFCIGDGSFCINPLNWKTDGTPAGIDENLGSAEIDPVTLKKTLVKGKASARIDLARGALVCDVCPDQLAKVPLFGDKSFHAHDWDFFYRNIQENGRKRITSYFGK